MDLVGGIEFIVHEASDDASFADGLIAQEHELVLGQRGYHGHAGRSESQFRERERERRKRRKREKERTLVLISVLFIYKVAEKPPSSTKTGFWATPLTFYSIYLTTLTSLLACCSFPPSQNACFHPCVRHSIFSYVYIYI